MAHGKARLVSQSYCAGIDPLARHAHAIRCPSILITFTSSWSITFHTLMIQVLFWAFLKMLGESLPPLRQSVPNSNHLLGESIPYQSLQPFTPCSLVRDASAIGKSLLLSTLSVHLITLCITCRSLPLHLHPRTPTSLPPPSKFYTPMKTSLAHQVLNIIVTEVENTGNVGRGLSGTLIPGRINNNKINPICAEGQGLEKATRLGWLLKWQRTMQN